MTGQDVRFEGLEAGEAERKSARRHTRFLGRQGR
jgi:hypothetical protein